MTRGVGVGTQPERIGRYRILERIGKGAMGVVYSARDEAMDRVVALKVMMADLEGDPDTRTRFYREAQSAGRLLHPNIITIFDMGEDEGHIYIVMELLKGDTLGDFLKRPGTVPLEQKVSLMVQVCEGLSAAHVHSIFHRDIKPGNLFVIQDGTLKILDFGVARLASSTMTASGFIIGTPDYMSPEQARGREVDQRSDIFSSAAVFYYMLSGRKPFAAPDLPAVLRKVQFEDPPPLAEADAPAPLSRLVLKSLSKDPVHRHQKMTEFAADLAKFKRYYEAETRQIAATARDRYGAIEDLVKERVDLCQRLGLPPPEDQPEAARRLREEHAAFVGQDRDALLLVPFTRPVIAEITASLCAEHQPLSRDVARLREAGDVIEAVDQALAAGRPDQGLARLDAAAATVMDAPGLRAARDRCQRAVAEQQARGERLATLASETRSALEAQTWSVAIALADEALQIDPEAGEFPALRLRAREALDRGERERARNQQRALDHVERAIAERRLEAAERELAVARQLEAPHDRTEPLERLLAEARHAAAVEAAIAERASEAITGARAAFQAGRRDDAVAVLQACLDVEPAAPGVQRELNYLQAEIRRLAEVERRRAAIAAHLRRAGEASEVRDFAAAVREAADALALDPGHVDASRIHATAQAALRVDMATRERRAQAAERLTAARALFNAGAWPRATREAQRVLDIEAGHPEALDLLRHIENSQAEQEAAQDRARQQRERARTIQLELKAARQALRSNDADQAQAAVRRVLALEPTDTAALGLLDEIAALRDEGRPAAPGTEDETVALVSAPAADEDITVRLAPASGGDRHIVSRIGSRLRAMWSRRVFGRPSNGRGQRGA